MECQRNLEQSLLMVSRFWQKNGSVSSQLTFHVEIESRKFWQQKTQKMEPRRGGVV
jgi:hypothetical protein